MLYNAYNIKNFLFHYRPFNGVARNLHHYKTFLITTNTVIWRHLGRRQGMLSSVIAFPISGHLSVPLT